MGRDFICTEHCEKEFLTAADRTFEPVFKHDCRLTGNDVLHYHFLRQGNDILRFALMPEKQPG